MERPVLVGVLVVKELVLENVQKDVADAIIFVKPNAVVLVHRVPVVSVAVTIVLDHVDMQVVIQPHVLVGVIHPHVLPNVRNLVIRRVNM